MVASGGARQAWTDIRKLKRVPTVSRKGFLNSRTQERFEYWLGVFILRETTSLVTLAPPAR